MRLIAVRHGETEWNAKGKYQGQIDLPLSDGGRKEAKRVAERLKNEKIDAFYASSLTRAIETASIIAEPHGLPVNIIPDLQEMDFGEWEGLTAEEIKKNYGEESYKTWLVDPEAINIPGGEKIKDFALRVKRGLEQVLKAHAQDTVVVVTHGGALMVMGCFLQGQELSCFRRYYHHNAALSVVEIEGDMIHFELINDREHLQTDV